MGKKKKQFINKKSAQKFNLVHRSQRDPLQADEDSAQHVLVPANKNQEPDESFEGASASDVHSREEHSKYGIYYDDDYDYLQHLKPRGGGYLMLAEDINETKTEDKSDSRVSFGNILLPPEVLPSKHEEDIGMLNKGVLPRGPQPDWDPDIVAALDDDLDLEDPDNILEDNFMTLAGGKNNENTCDDNIGEYETESDISNGSYVDSDNLLSDEEFDDSEEETKSRFTNYSMTSSIIRRTEGLKLLDDRFERIMEEYDENEIGCIDHEDVTGKFSATNELVSQVMDEFIDNQRLHELSETQNQEESNKVNDHKEEKEDESDNDENLFVQFEKSPKSQWDCESIISTYSNLYNHPKVITEEKKVRLHKHTGIPVGVLQDKKKSTNKDDVEETEEIISLKNIRNKNESAEERRQRKKDVKELRKNRRVEKKNNKLLFKNEYTKQEKAEVNTSIQKGIKM